MNKSTVRIVAPDNTVEDTLTNDEDIVEKLLNGASLRTFMIPDSSIPSNFPEHIETYDLPHVIINREYFWGKSETAHLSYSIGSTELRRASFGYTNNGNIFCTYNPDFDRIVLMSKNRYKKHIWLVKENYRLIWDSAEAQSAEVVRNNIGSCSRFKIAMLDSEDIWNIHPVDLPMYYSGEGRFQLKTAMDSYPAFFRYPSETNRILESEHDFFDTKPSDSRSGTWGTDAAKFYTFYSLGSDGTYYNIYDVPRNTTQNYKRLKVFVDRSV